MGKSKHFFGILLLLLLTAIITSCKQEVDSNRIFFEIPIPNSKAALAAFQCAKMAVLQKQISISPLR